MDKINTDLIQTEAFHWSAVDGPKIYGHYWAPENEVKAVICLVHGMGEHCERYDAMAHYLARYGFAMIGFDQRGHGRTEGKKGHTPSYNHLLFAVDDLLSKAEEYFPEIPQFLYGHSMGGNVVANYVLQKKPQIQGVIISSPWFKLAFEPPALQIKLGSLVNKLFPAFTQSTQLDASKISQVQEVVDKYLNDPLVHDKISTTFFLSVHGRGEWAMEHASEWPALPLLMYHGTGDEITSYEASRCFADEVTSSDESDVTYKLFDGAYHEIHNDVDSDELLLMVKDWLNEHV